MTTPTSNTCAADLLVVDDTPANLKLLTDLLRGQGYGVRAALSGELALGAVAQQPPDLILLDIKMPGIDGFEVCRELKNHPDSREIPIIFISALDDPGDKVRAFEAGGVDFITKPFEATEVLARVHTHLSLARATHKLEQQVEERTAELKTQMRNNTLILDSAGEGIFGMDREGSHTFVNPAAERMLGWSATELLGKPSHAMWHYNRPDGTPYLLSECPICATIYSGKSHSGEEQFIRKDGTFFPVEYASHPIIDEGEVVGAVVSFIDMTERKRMQGLMMRTEKMMSVGGLAAGMAHEINNPLAGIMQGLQNIQRRLSPELDKNITAAQELGLDLAAVHAYLERRGISGFLQKTLEAGVRASGVVENMLQFARKPEFKLAPVHIGTLIDNTLTLAGMDYDLKKGYDFRNIKIEREYDSTVGSVSCIGSEIQQVLLNLLRNAAQALEGKDTREEPAKIVVHTRRENGMVCIDVKDNGPGMDEETQQRVFEPFFTTRGEGVGTGLGLSVSYFIVTQEHDGTMSVESSPGQGSTFTVCLQQDPSSVHS